MSKHLLLQRWRWPSTPQILPTIAGAFHFHALRNTNKPNNKSNNNVTTAVFGDNDTAIGTALGGCSETTINLLKCRWPGNVTSTVPRAIPAMQTQRTNKWHTRKQMDRRGEEGQTYITSHTSPDPVAQVDCCQILYRLLFLLFDGILLLLSIVVCCCGGR